MGNLVSYVIDVATAILKEIRDLLPTGNHQTGMPAMGLTTAAAAAPQAPVQPSTTPAAQPAAGGTSTTSPGTMSSPPRARLSGERTVKVSKKKGRFEHAALEAFKGDLEEKPDLAAKYKVKQPKVFEGPQLPEGYVPPNSSDPEGYVPPNSSDRDGEKDRKALEKWIEDMSHMGYLYYWNTFTRESVWVVSEKYLADQGLERAPSSQNEEPVVEEQEEQGIRVRLTQPIPQQPAAGASGRTRPKTRQRNSCGRKPNGGRRKSSQENFEVPEGTGLIRDFRLTENPNLPVYRSNAAVPDKDEDKNRKRKPDQAMYTLPMKR